MCRLAAYLGPAVLLEDFIHHGSHSLYEQSWRPREMQEATLNADGFGVAWQDQQQQLRAYRDARPIWNDPNLPDLSAVLSSHLWLGYVRSATPGQGLGGDNLQPFIHEGFAFFHNGYIKQFAEHKTRFIDMLPAEVLSNIKGNTDSEYCFALWRHCYQQQANLIDASQLFIQQLQQHFTEEEILLNLLLSDGETLIALKYALNQTAPSLYYLNAEDSVRIASEPLNEKTWITIPDHHLLHINQNRVCQLHPLL